MKVGIIGLGNMATAVLEGMLSSKMVTKGDVVGSAKSEMTCQNAIAKYDIEAKTDNKWVAKQADILVLAVKPQFLESVCEEIKDVLNKEQLIISLAAGKNLEWLESNLGNNMKIMRLMPNTAALVSESCTAICRGKNATDKDLELTLNICKSFGGASVIDEKLMNPFIGVSGSSVAYAFMYMEALADGAVAAGMPRNMAYEFAAQSTLGAAKLMLETKQHPGVLKDMVCSPGGTTIKAVESLENNGFRGAVMSAVKACIDRANEL